MVNSPDEIRRLLPSLHKELFNKPNVVATGIGYKRVNGKMTDDLSIICSVGTKQSVNSLTGKELIPKTIQGVITDVYPVGVINSLQLPTGRFRPAPGGVSIGHRHITAGTLGCLVRKENSTFILSNNHVLANSNQASEGDMILQPAPFDGGTVSLDYIAKLDSFIPIHFENEKGNFRLSNAILRLLNFLYRLTGSNTRFTSGTISQAGNLADCALAEPLNEGDLINEVLQTGTIRGITDGELGMKIKKSGRTTGLTTGIIEQIDVTVRVNFGTKKTALFTDQLIAGAMSQGGDSGSAVLSETNEVVGLLFAGSTNTTVINRIHNVFRLLDVSLI